MVERDCWVSREVLSSGKQENMGWTEEKNEPERKREEEPGEMEKLFSGEKKILLFFSKSVQSYHPMTTVRFVTIDQARCTYLCMALPKVESYCQM